MTGRPDPPGRAQRWSRALLAAYLLAGAWLTLRPSPMGRVSRPVIRAVHDLSGLSWQVSGRLAERGGNVLLFVPLGLLLCWALPRLRRRTVWSLCVAASVGIEVTQYLFLPARYPSLVDIATNSTGAAVGVGLHWLLTRRRTTPTD
ncbi:VanZ family protein [Modestobacter italicus]|uniref:VanZ family protein n=1 Tax=Modestobacter italicus (strain DSM 44449 / CECT 9708 / BC 501) TaxID=2732864 RepID=UPI001C982DD2|nr:VanZ family protein [Modestobacter italicus]